MSTTSIQNVTSDMCGEGVKIARSWHKSAGKPGRITARHVFDVLKSRHDRSYRIRWGWVMRVISRLLTTHQIKRVVVATKGRRKKPYYGRRDYKTPPCSSMVKMLLNSMYDDKIEVLEYALSRKR